MAPPLQHAEIHHYLNNTIFSLTHVKQRSPIPKHHSRRVYKVYGGKFPCILGLGIRWRQVAGNTLWTLNPQGKTPITTGEEIGSAPEPV
jgi:hypothetical protein